jgi:hypothetical protein
MYTDELSNRLKFLFRKNCRCKFRGSCVSRIDSYYKDQNVNLFDNSSVLCMLLLCKLPEDDLKKIETCWRFIGIYMKICRLILVRLMCIVPCTVVINEEEEPTRRYLVFYYTYDRLSMFRTALCPSSGAHDYISDYHMNRLILRLLRCRLAGFQPSARTLS